MRRLSKRLIKFSRRKACLQRYNLIFSEGVHLLWTLAHTVWVWSLNSSCWDWISTLDPWWLYRAKKSHNVCENLYPLDYPLPWILFLLSSIAPFSLSFFFWFMHSKYSCLQDRSFSSWMNREEKCFHQSSVNLSEFTNKIANHFIF